MIFDEKFDKMDNEIDYIAAIWQYKEYVINRDTVQKNLAFKTYQKLCDYRASTFCPRTKEAWDILVENLEVKKHWNNTYHFTSHRNLKNIFEQGVPSHPQIGIYGAHAEFTELVHEDMTWNYPFKHFLEKYNKAVVMGGSYFERRRYRRETIEYFMSMIETIKKNQLKKPTRFTSDLLPAGTFFTGFIMKDDDSELRGVFYRHNQHIYMADQVTFEVHTDNVRAFDPETVEVTRVIPDIKDYAHEKDRMYTFDGTIHLES